MKRPALFRSIAGRVVALVLIVELLAAIVVTASAFVYERHAHFRSFDVALRGRADTVMGAVEDADDRDLGVMLDTTDLKLPPDDVYAVREDGLKELGRTPGWSPGADMWTGPVGFFSIQVRDRAYRGLRLRGVRVVDPMSENVRHPITVLYAAPVERVWQAVAGAVEVFALANGLLVLVTALLVPAIVRRGLEPLHALAKDAGAITVGAWAFSPGNEVRSAAELRPLVGALEALVARLERSFTQQRQFVGDAAHELKTGVAVVKSSIQLLEMRSRTATEYEAGLSRCFADCLRMEELAQRMLLLARVEEAGSLDGVGVSQVAEAVEATLAELAPLAALHGVTLGFAAEEGLSVALAPELLRSLLTNLVTNGVQYSAAGTEVRVDVSFDAGVRIAVKDQGEGIQDKALPFVFDRFYRGDPSRSKNTGGTGLGLAICKAIVERAEGEIGIDSRLGVGTTVWVRLPVIWSRVDGVFRLSSGERVETGGSPGPDAVQRPTRVPLAEYNQVQPGKSRQ